MKKPLDYIFDLPRRRRVNITVYLPPSIGRCECEKIRRMIKRAVYVGRLLLREGPTDQVIIQVRGAGSDASNLGVKDELNRLLTKHSKRRKLGLVLQQT